MLLPTHALAGAIIGKNLNDSWLIVIFAIAIHFVMDSFRHGEYLYADSNENTIKNSAWKAALEISTAVFVVFAVLYALQPDLKTCQNMLLGSFFSVLPDFITFLYWLNKKNQNIASTFLKKYYAFHSWIHAHPRNAPERAWTFRNARNDIIFSALAIIFLFL